MRIETNMEIVNTGLMLCKTVSHFILNAIQCSILLECDGFAQVRCETAAMEHEINEGLTIFYAKIDCCK